MEGSGNILFWSKATSRPGAQELNTGPLECLPLEYNIGLNVWKASFSKHISMIFEVIKL
jgi:hypothetical protein